MQELQYVVSLLLTPNKFKMHDIYHGLLFIRLGTKLRKYKY